MSPPKKSLNKKSQKNSRPPKTTCAKKKVVIPALVLRIRPHGVIFRPERFEISFVLRSFEFLGSTKVSPETRALGIEHGAESVLVGKPCH